LSGAVSPSMSRSLLLGVSWSQAVAICKRNPFFVACACLGNNC
jgi:hypothetical protein